MTLENCQSIESQSQESEPNEESGHKVKLKHIEILQESKIDYQVQENINKVKFIRKMRNKVKFEKVWRNTIE